MSKQTILRGLAIFGLGLPLSCTQVVSSDGGGEAADNPANNPADDLAVAAEYVEADGLYYLTVNLPEGFPSTGLTLKVLDVTGADSPEPCVSERIAHEIADVQIDNRFILPTSYWQTEIDLDLEFCLFGSNAELVSFGRLIVPHQPAPAGDDGAEDLANDDPPPAATTGGTETGDTSSGDDGVDSDGGDEAGDDGEDDDSDPTPPVPPPVLPGDFSLLGPTGTIADGQPLVSWTASADVVSYAVYLASDAGCTMNLRAAAGQTTTSWQIPAPDLASGTYYLCATASNVDGSTEASNSGLSFTVDLLPPANIDDLSASTGNGRLGDVDIQLDFPDDTSDYADAWLRVDSNSSGIPPASCAFDDLVEINSLTDHTITVSADPSKFLGITLCLQDAVGNINSSQVAQAIPFQVQRAFVSSATFEGNLIVDYQNINGGNFSSGLEGGDARCQYEAELEGLEGRWQAILSDENFDAEVRLSSYGPLHKITTTGTEYIATSLADGFSDGQLDNAALNTAADGTAMAGLYTWTGTAQFGDSSGLHCDDWRSNSGGEDASLGSTNTISGFYWVDGDQNTSCDDNHHLYCVETGNIAPAKRPAAFTITTATYDADGRIYVSWDELGDADEYYLSIYDELCTSDFGEVDGIVGEEFTWPVVLPAATYTVVVEASNAQGSREATNNCLEVTP